MPASAVPKMRQRPTRNSRARASASRSAGAAAGTKRDMSVGPPIARDDEPRVTIERARAKVP